MYGQVEITRATIMTEEDFRRSSEAHMWPEESPLPPYKLRLELSKRKGPPTTFVLLPTGRCSWMEQFRLHATGQGAHEEDEEENHG